MARTKKRKVQIKRQKVWLGWANRIYIDGTYMGAGLTRASARHGAKRMLVNYERARRCTSAK
jgi:hypothetical protein